MTLKKILDRGLVKYSATPGASAPTPAGNNDGAARLGAAVSAFRSPKPPALQQPPASSPSFGAALQQDGKKIWDNGGKHVWNNGGEQVWNSAGAPAVKTLVNTLHGAGTAGVGAANAAAGAIGSVGGGLGYLAGGVTDATGLTRGAQKWVGDNVLRHMTRAVGAGVVDTLGGAADTLSLGNYDYDGTFAAPGQHPGTYVEQMRSDIRDELGRGSDLDRVFTGTNAAADFAATTAATGGMGRAVGAAGRTLQGAQAIPVVGRPLAAVGQWAGRAPTVNMFRQTPTQYYRAAGPMAYVDDAVNAKYLAQEAMNPVLSDRPLEHQQYNEVVRPHIEGAYQTQGLVNQARRADNTDYAMNEAMVNDPAMQNRLLHAGVPANEQPATIDALVPELLAESRQPAQPAAQPTSVDGVSANAGENPAPNQAAAAGGMPPMRSSWADTDMPTSQQVGQLVNDARIRGQNEQAIQQTGIDAARMMDNADPGGLRAQNLNPSAEQPTQPQTQLDTGAVSAQLQHEDPKIREQGIQTVATHAAANATPEGVNRAKAIAAGGEAGAAAAAQGADTFTKQQVDEAVANAPPEVKQDPTSFGAFVGQVSDQAQQMWNSFGPMGQAAFMIGVPAALIGLLSGDGLMGILGGLGIGALGIGAGAMGMFGEGAQRGMGQMLGSLAETAGIISPEMRDSGALSPAAAAASRERIGSILESQGADAAQQALNAERAKFEQLQGIHNINPELAHTYLMGMRGDYAPKTREEAASVYDRLAKQYAETGQKDYLLSQARPLVAQRVAGAQSAVPAGVRGAARLARNAARSAAAERPALRALLDMVPQRLRAGANDLLDPEQEVVQRHLDRLGFKEVKASDMNITKKLAYHYITTKAARCWEGYEPVPGAKAYSRGSCRPVGSKKTQKEMKSGKERHHEATKQSGAKG